MPKGRLYADEDEEDEEEEFEDGDDLQDGDRDNDRGEGSDEEEDEEEGQDEYEKDGFIVDEEEDEEEADEGARQSSDEEAKARKKKRKKRSEENDELDEDDYELLREHNVFHRPKSGNKTKFKRLKKAGRAGGDDGGAKVGLSDEDDEEDDGNRRGRTAEEELKLSLFGDDEGEPADDVAEEEPEEEEEIDEEDDEMADFIVDEEEGDEEGFPGKRRKPKKRRAPKVAPGISTFALQEAQDIFGDVTTLLDERRQRELESQKAETDMGEDGERFGRRPSKFLEQFEPSLLEEKFMTERDDRIRDIDVPERLQLLEEVVGTFPTDDGDKEAAWIYERAFAAGTKWKSAVFEKLTRKNPEDVLRQIAHVLHLLHEEKLELSFIAMYRMEKCLDLVQDFGDHQIDPNSDSKSELRRREALWAVQHWDKKWLMLQRRKAGLEVAFEKRRALESEKDSSKEEVFQRLLDSLSEAQSDQTVDDVDAKFNLLFPLDEIEVEQGQFKRPKRRSLYSYCRKAGLGSLAARFGLTTEKFAENMSVMYKKHEVEDESLSPEEAAREYLSSEFRDPQAVLKGAKHMAVVEIGTEPVVRQFTRNLFMKYAVVNTKPTTDGNTVIDPFHEYASVKWLRNKPLDKFDDAQWLLIQKAEDEKILEVKIGLDLKQVEGNLLSELISMYVSHGVSAEANLWNELRMEILQDVVHKVLLPAMDKEARSWLSSRAREFVAGQCAKELWSKVSAGPYVPEKTDAHFDSDGLNPRVMACCWGPGKPATTFVMLDSSGEIVNILHTGYLTIRDDTHEQRERKKQDQAKLLDFVMENQPHVVVLGAASLACRKLKDEIFEVIFKIVEEHPRDLAEGLSTIGVVYGDETIPQLYENSRISEEQLVGHPGIVRRAVALGRYLQNPLAMVATLCGPAREILSLKLDSLQSCLTADEVYETVERIMVTVSNQVGVDVNLAASHDWLFAPLQFIAGLGPRKASYIQRSIQGAGRVSTRKELLATLRLMGRKVFINCAGFIRVRGTGQASSGNQIMDPLDDTRIHPESYELAKRMAEDAYCETEGTRAEDMYEDALELAIEYVRTRPNVLENMDLEAYASHLSKKGPTASVETLQMIRTELQTGYIELRSPLKPLSQDEEFNMLSGETDETLAEGSIVHAKVRKIQHTRVMCVLESGLLGIINKEDLSDDTSVDPSDKVSEDTIVTCRVMSVQKAKYMVELTCKGSALRGENWPNRRPMDPFYHEDKAFLRGEQEKAKKKNEDDKKNAFKPRMIVHPQFQNVSLADAMKALAEKDVGEVIIRPSSKGPSHLSMTLKFYDEVYVHIDIVEGGKDSRDLTSFLRLGKTLTIGEETFEDLDEVVARYLDPLVGHLKDVLRYRKFRRGLKAEVDEALREEKVKEPRRIPYFFNICHEHPGAFILSYIKNVHTVTHEYISVSPKGLKYRKRLFDSPDKLVSYFQKHFSDPLPDVAPRRAMAAMVPPRSPAPGAQGNLGYTPQRSRDGGPGWEPSPVWDRNGSSGRTGDSRRRSGTWEQSQAPSSSGGSWAPPGPPQGTPSAWNGWGGLPPPPPGGYSGRSQGTPVRSGAEGGWGANAGYPDGPSASPSDSSWASRKPPTSGSGWESRGSAYDRPPERTPQRSGWDSEQESQLSGRSGWDEEGSRAKGAGGSGGKQSRGDPRRAGGGRDDSREVGRDWDQDAAKESSGWDTPDPSSQSRDSSAVWGESRTEFSARRDGGSPWTSSAGANEAPSSRWEPSDRSGQSGGTAAPWDAPSDSTARKGPSASFSNSVERTTPRRWEHVGGPEGNEVSGQPSVPSPTTESGWGASPGVDNWDTSEGRNNGTPARNSDPRRTATGGSGSSSGWSQQAPRDQGGGPGRGSVTKSWDQQQPGGYTPTSATSDSTYSPTTSGWIPDWNKVSVRSGTEGTDRTASPKTRWGANPPGPPDSRGTNNWSSDEPRAPGDEGSTEPAAPGTSDPATFNGTAGVEGGPPFNSSTPRDKSVPWVWSGAT